MRTVLSIAISMLLTCLGVGAQERSASSAYVFVAPGAAGNSDDAKAFLHFGAGADLFLTRGFALSPEIGYLGAAGNFDDGFGVFSANASYHFTPAAPGARVVPFLTGGYSAAFGAVAAHGGNIGGGFTWWLAERHGVRVEVRDNVVNFGPPAHFVGFRLAWVLR